MTNIITGFSIVFMSFLNVSGQIKKVVVNAEIRDLPANSYVYWSSINSLNDDSVKTIRGGFHFEIPMKAGEGNIYIIQIGGKITDDSREVLYLDEGNLIITGEGPQFKDAKLSGSQYVLDYNDFLERIGQNPGLQNQKEIYEKANELVRINDTIGLEALRPKLHELDSIKIVISKKWIALHPASPVSTFILYFYVRNSLNINQLDSVLQQLSPEAKNNLIAKSLSNSIRVENETNIGKPAIDFTQNDTSGKPVSLTDFRGKYVLLDFWASWCHPCRMENPNLVTACKKFGPANFTVLSVSLDLPGQKERWIKAIHEDGLNWSHVSDLNGWNNAAAKLYDIQSVPSNFLIDPNGIIVAKNLRGDDLDKKLSEILGD